jgi:hypothetical protein
MTLMSVHKAADVVVAAPDIKKSVKVSPNSKVAKKLLQEPAEVSAAVTAVEPLEDMIAKVAKKATRSSAIARPVAARVSTRAAAAKALKSVTEN